MPDRVNLVSRILLIVSGLTAGAMFVLILIWFLGVMTRHFETLFSLRG